MGKRNAKKVRTRAFLYSPGRPNQGVLFQSADAIAEALEQGWEESPDAARAVGKKQQAGKGKGQNNGGAKKVTTGDNS